MGCGKSFSSTGKNIIRGGMMMKKNQLLAGAVLLSLAGWNGAAAADQVYTLNPVVVTAQRMETVDLKVPATTTVISAKDIKDKGYTSVFDALEQTVGVDSYSYSNSGEDLGGAQSRFYIRGMDKGTLVLVNGAPINIMNYSSTEGIPKDAIEKIEVIKGANSVLYGAEAMGGVVNIITKRNGEPKVTIGGTVGNYHDGFHFGVQGECFNFFYDKDYYNEFNEANRIFKKSTYAWKNGKGHKDSFYGSVNLTDKLSLDWSRVSAQKNRFAMEVKNGVRTGNIRTSGTGKYEYDTQKNNLNLVYDDKDAGVKSILAFNNRRIDSTYVKYDKKQNVKGTSRGTNYNVYGITFDNQKNWHFNRGRDNLIAGVTYHYDHYKELENTDNRIGRRNYSVYGSYSHDFTDRLTGVFGVRGEFVRGNGWDDTHNVFLPQIQFLYKLSDIWSLYSNVGKSFDMPAINSKYYSPKLINWHIRPQTGWTYEFGSKYISGKDSLKLDIFHMRVKDKFEWVRESDLIPGGSKDISVQVNGGEFRNTGLEAEYIHVVNDNWQFNLGASLSNPQIKDGDKWRQEAAKTQFNAGIHYGRGKFNAGINYFLTADREDSYYTNDGTIAKKGKKWDHAIPNRSILNAVFNYAPNKSQDITLSMYNLLNRHNCINENENWDLPFNWILSYRLSF